MKRYFMTIPEACDLVLQAAALGTGGELFRFLAPELARAVRTVNGYPVLDRGFQASVPGLYFVGASAAYSFGPLCRFVAGNGYAARALTRSAVKRPAPRHRVMVAMDAAREMAPATASRGGTE